MPEKATSEIVTGFRPGYLGRIAAQHGEFYAEVWGSGTDFESQMARELAAYHDTYDPTWDLLLTAHVDGRFVGSMAVQGEERPNPTFARLRWFLLDPGYHGKGIGSELLRRALAFCRDCGFQSVYLWTVEGLPQSLGMYERAGFRIVERHPAATYGVDHIHLRLERVL